MTRALLALEDGTTFPGRSLGASGETFGEVVFNTGMSGYQEVLTDPSYARQIVVMTYPHQGNYGVNAEDAESWGVRVAGFVVREAARRPSSWRAQRALGEYLAEAGVVGIDDLDTRSLTLHIREAGAMRAGISTDDLDPGSLVERVRRQPGMAGADLARTVSTERPYVGDGQGPVRFRVAAFDWGLKRNSLRLLARSGCATTVYPALTPAEEVLREGFDGVFLSNGPGDPAATPYAVETARRLLGRVPVFGICLGHQVLARALGGSTYKLRFGHRGANQPVVDLDTARVAVTSHNHGFAVDPAGWEAASSRSRGGGDPTTAVAAMRGTPVVHTNFGRVALTHWNLNDGVLEGLRCVDVPAFSVQYHPEAAPGPHDSVELFDRFTALMEAAR
ncbi:MAG TPA: glutamine-hydrolyzing carbamoyl-phosphate synthase small subunit [Actinomycetota bacterium]|nr:glutamine-hydrolyzing carbamoyl-phosphate synthase small subunit [Actinomycetota bacterium]